MRCPQCGSVLRPWPWQDGGYKGVQCDPCGQKWFSDSFADDAYEAERTAVSTLVTRLSFPKDAVTEADYWKSPEDVKS